ncbi:hypothetical protein BGX38DRAFT_1273029 [Terfezia claveryi]|nr:hypothetical protein BGX38DRAFT_1273029 [Terfezia claveryi]
MSTLTGAAGFFQSLPSLVPMSIPLAPCAGTKAQTTSQKPRATPGLQLQNSGKRKQIPPITKADSEGPDVAQDIVHFNALREAGKDAAALNEDINHPGIQTGNYLLKDEGSDLGILADEEEADGSDDEQGDYITEEDAVQYGTITFGEEIV